MFTVSILLAALMLLALTQMMGLNTTHVPTPQDDDLRLESSATKTATFNGTTYDNGLRFAPGGLGMQAAAVVLPSAADRANSDESYTFVLEESDDNSTWNVCGPSVALPVSGTTATLDAFSVPGWVSKRYVRLKCTIAGTTPSITYEAWLNFNF